MECTRKVLKSCQLDTADKVAICSGDVTSALLGDQLGGLVAKKWKLNQMDLNPAKRCKKIAQVHA